MCEVYRVPGPTMFEGFANCLRRERAFLCVPAPKQPQYLIAHTRLTAASVMSYKRSHTPIANRKSSPDSGKYCKRFISCRRIHASQCTSTMWLRGCKVAVSRACDGREPVMRLSLNMTQIHTNPTRRAPSLMRSMCALHGNNTDKSLVCIRPHP